MHPTWAAIEELARTSDETAVRRRFDERNRVWIVVLLVFFGVFSILQTSQNLVADIRRCVQWRADGARIANIVAATRSSYAG